MFKYKDDITDFSNYRKITKLKIPRDSVAFYDANIGIPEEVNISASPDEIYVHKDDAFTKSKMLHKMSEQPFHFTLDHLFCTVTNEAYVCNVFFRQITFNVFDCEYSTE